jgi:hypothetical protein
MELVDRLQAGSTRLPAHIYMGLKLSILVGYAKSELDALRAASGALVFPAPNDEVIDRRLQMLHVVQGVAFPPAVISCTVDLLEKGLPIDAFITIVTMLLNTPRDHYEILSRTLIQAWKLSTQSSSDVFLVLTQKFFAPLQRIVTEVFASSLARDVIFATVAQSEEEDSISVLVSMFLQNDGFLAEMDEIKGRLRDLHGQVRDRITEEMAAYLSKACE